VWNDKLEGWHNKIKKLIKNNEEVNLPPHFKKNILKILQVKL